MPPGSLLDDDEAFQASEQQLADQWVDEIAGNIEGLLSTTPGFRLNAKYAEVMGSTLGVAREMHVRSALKRLQSAGVLSSNCVGERKLQDHFVTRA